MSSRISKQAPRFCNVYVVSKGKLSSVRPPASGTDDSPRAESNSSFRSLGHSSDSFSVKSGNCQLLAIHTLLPSSLSFCLCR